MLKYQNNIRSISSGDSTGDYQEILISGYNIRTINGQSIIGPGNIIIETSGGGIETETDPIFTAQNKSTGISITESQISDLRNYLLSEVDPIFTAQNKSDGISITESQISDLKNYVITETDPVFVAWDKSTGISITKDQVTDFGTYQSPLVSGTNIKTINGQTLLGEGNITIDSTGGGIPEETDPIFIAQNKSDGISITESQISDFKNYQLELISGTNIKTINGQTLLGNGNISIDSTGGGIPEETDPIFIAQNKSDGISITESQISDLKNYVITETDPVFTAQNKSDGISITESQISDLRNYLLSETDPIFTAQNKSDGISITESQISDLRNYLLSETDPVFTSQNKSDGISITESQISDFGTYNPTLISGTNIKTINGQTLLGSGDLLIDYTGIEEEIDPIFTAWDKSTGISITKDQVTDFGTYQQPLISGANIKTINGQTLLGAGDLLIEGVGGGDTTPMFGPGGFEVLLSEYGNGTNTFTLSKIATRVLVAIDGILQTDFTQPSGTDQLVLGFIPSDTKLVTVYSVNEVSGAANIIKVLDTTTDGTAFEFILNDVVNSIFVFLDGVLQQDYIHVAGSNTVSFNFIPLDNNNLTIFSVSGGMPVDEKLLVDHEVTMELLLSTTGDGTSTEFILSRIADNIMVFVDGIFQPSYSMLDSTNVLNLEFAPLSDELLTVYSMKSKGILIRSDLVADNIEFVPVNDMTSTSVQDVIVEINEKINNIPIGSQYNIGDIKVTYAPMDSTQLRCDSSTYLNSGYPELSVMMETVPAGYNYDPDDWDIQVSAADNAWQDICWSPELELFCAVAESGTNNRVMTSIDGINWNIQNTPADNSQKSVCQSQELSIFCAVAESGTNNRVMTSADGINWNIRTSAADNQQQSICQSPELSLFVAVARSGSGNRVMTSSDGINQITRTSASDNDQQSVCWSSELTLFVAVGKTGIGTRVMTSPNGINQTTRASAADNSWYEVCYSPERSLFVAVANSGEGNRVMTSPDGTNWTIRTSAADNAQNFICQSPELSLFVAVSSNGTNNRIMTSSDGINWTSRLSATDNNQQSVCWSSELYLFCSVANSGTENRVMTSQATAIPSDSFRVPDLGNTTYIKAL